MPVVSVLSLGVNLMGYTGDVNMIPGEALMAQDVLPRVNGSIMTHWGWPRRNATALADPVIWHKGFTYKGKNAGADARTGNYGADTGAAFTRRAAFYAGQLVLTDVGAFRWDVVTGAYIAVALPGGVAVRADPHPCGFVAQDSLYICGWADANLRYDPTDERLYVIGWPDEPALAATGTPQAGGNLVDGAVYSWRASWVDLYTGEQSGLGTEYQYTVAGGNQQVSFVAALPNPGWALNDRRRWNPAAPEQSDVGIAIYRTEADKGLYNFLGLVFPDDAAWNGLGAATQFSDGTALVDDGLATDATRPEFVRDYFDPPAMDGWVYHKKMWFGIAWEMEARDVSQYAVGKTTPSLQNPNRVYYCDFTTTSKPQLERWKPLDYREISTGEGDVLTCLAPSPTQITVFSTETAYNLEVTANTTTLKMDVEPTPLGYEVGALGPRAWCYHAGRIYWISRKGPYRAVPMGVPEWIGKNLSPMFIDPESGLCQLNPAAALRSQVAYDQDANMIRFLVPCGLSTTMNRHFGWWTLGPLTHEDDPYHGWFFFSAMAQWLDFTHAMCGLDPATAAPQTQWDRPPRMVFSDDLGYMYEYTIGVQRGGLVAGAIASGLAEVGANSTINNIRQAGGGLYNAGDGMIGLRLEVVHLDGTIDIRTVLGNDADDIQPDVAFSADPDGGAWYVGGIPAYWLSWVDHNGMPQSHKDLTHLFVSFNRQTTDPNTVVDMTVAAADDFPGAFNLRREVNVDRNTRKLLVALVGRFFQYEMSCSRPDQRFCLTSLEREPVNLPGLRDR